MPLIMPLPGENAGELAQELLALADHRDEVTWAVGPDWFEVSQAVADRYLESLNHLNAQLDGEEQETSTPAPKAGPAAPKRTRGPNKPKKDGK